LEIYSEAGGTRFIPYEILETTQLDIPLEMSADDHNRLVEKNWKDVCKCDDAKQWLNNICHVSFEAVKRLIGARPDSVY